MTPLDLDFVPEAPASASGAVLAARHRRVLVVGLGGGRRADSARATSSSADPAARSSAGAAAVATCASARPSSVASTSGTRIERAVDHAVDSPAPARNGPSPGRPAPASSMPAAVARLDDALVIPAGALVRGYVRCRALLLAGDVVGNVHCTAGPVVIRSGASLKGRLVAAGDVYVCGTAGDAGGGTVITTYGKLTLAPGARVDGDVRSGRLDLYDGAMLNGVAKGCED